MRKTCFILLSVISASFLGGNALDQLKDDYAGVKIKKFPLAMQCWTYRRFTFLEAVEKTRALGIKYIQAYPGQQLSPADKQARFDHMMTDSEVGEVRQALANAGLEVVSYGVVDLGRTEESMRRVFDFARKLRIRFIVTEPQFEDFLILEKLVKEYDIKIAIHNHPEPTRYAKPETVLEKIKDLDSRIGACADTGHWMRGLRVPAEALRLLSGRLIDVHLKDRSDFCTGQGVADVPLGKGKANIRDILAELTLQNYGGCLTIEYENEAEAMTPEPAIQAGIDFIRDITYFEGYEEILKRSRGRYSKHGWNHYGPGHFELDEQEGILKSQGGMGLFWYSAKKYKDFVLELNYRCAQKNTNSGVFLRVPDVPASDDYIYHSFEVQINDAGQGIERTGAVFDAEPPRLDAAKPTGEWNHLKIVFQGNHIQVELNGTVVLDWKAEPRGKVRDFAGEGYIGLQNHDSLSPVYFRNIFIKELS